MYTSKSFIYQDMCFNKAQETREMEIDEDIKTPVI
jgi:hypothetical protein